METIISILEISLIVMAIGHFCLNLTLTSKLLIGKQLKGKEIKTVLGILLVSIASLVTFFWVPIVLISYAYAIYFLVMSSLEDSLLHLKDRIWLRNIKTK